MSLKIVSIIGARPQFIKYFSLSLAMKKYLIRDILIHTGQHYDYSMSEIFFKELSLKRADYHLGVGSASRAKQVSQIVKKACSILSKENPDAVLVYGDTNSTYGGALAAAKSGIPVLHVEAGLRSYDKKMPEELNRVLTDQLSSLLFCPSRQAVSNLIKEGFGNIINGGRLVPRGYFKKKCSPDKNNALVVNTGDIMYDSLKYFSNLIQAKSALLKDLGIKRKDYYLFTLHRQSNTDNSRNFSSIINYINSTAFNKTVIFPMHPRAGKYYKGVKNKFSSNVRIIQPVGYFEILNLLSNSSLLFTDSGGMQKEAYWLGVPCVTLRDETEWGETIKSGWNILYKNYDGKLAPKQQRKPVYGDGRAADRIAELIVKTLGG